MLHSGKSCDKVLPGGAGLWAAAAGKQQLILQVACSNHQFRMPCCRPLSQQLCADVAVRVSSKDTHPAHTFRTCVSLTTVCCLSLQVSGPPSSTTAAWMGLPAAAWRCAWAVSGPSGPWAGSPAGQEAAGPTAAAAACRTTTAAATTAWATAGAAGAAAGPGEVRHSLPCKRHFTNSHPAAMCQQRLCWPFNADSVAACVLLCSSVIAVAEHCPAAMLKDTW